MHQVGVWERPFIIPASLAEVLVIRRAAVTRVIADESWRVLELINREFHGGVVVCCQGEVLELVVGLWICDIVETDTDLTRVEVDNIFKGILNYYCLGGKVYFAYFAKCLVCLDEADQVI